MQSPDTSSSSESNMDSSCNIFAKYMNYQDPLVKYRESETDLDISSSQFALLLDSQDPLADYRESFIIPKNGNLNSQSIYLNGNSLGLQPVTTKEYLNRELDKWADHGVEGHFTSPLPWVTADEDCIPQMSRIVGAKPIEITLMNSLTVNLHLMMVAFYRPSSTRFKILIEDKAFPSDMIKYHGFDPDSALIRMKPRENEHTLQTSDILKIIQEEGDSIALVLFSGVQYYTGQFFEMEKITSAGHEKGCYVGFDLAHAVGNVPLELNAWNIDFAVWCTYKYLNGSPGSTGGCFVHERHAHDFSLPRFAGWWGHQKEDRFLMEPDFVPSPGVFGFQLSNPPVLCLAAIRASLDIFDQTSMEQIREKSILLTGLLEYLIDTKLSKHVTILTPKDPFQRGCQLSLSFNIPIKQAHEKITAKGIICDLREPNVIRIAPCPLYNTFMEVWKFVDTLASIIDN